MVGGKPVCDDNWGMEEVHETKKTKDKDKPQATKIKTTTKTKTTTTGAWRR